MQIKWLTSDIQEKVCTSHAKEVDGMNGLFLIVKSKSVSEFYLCFRTIL